jgi:uncharacterized protein involved in type VI secretion and phage assembly
MSLWDQLLENDGETQRIFGVVTGLVTNNQDPDRLGRVKIQFPWLSKDDESNWARIAAPMAGKNGAAFFLPEVDDEVLVAFEQGDIDHPYVLGALWNGRDRPPADNQDGHNNVRLIQSRSGHLVRLDDTNGDEKIEIIDQSGKNKIVIKTADNSITITAEDKLEIKAKGDISLNSSGGKITLQGNEVEIQANTSIKAESQANLDLKANAQLKIKGATVNIN